MELLCQLPQLKPEFETLYIIYMCIRHLLVNMVAYPTPLFLIFDIRFVDIFHRQMRDVTTYIRLDVDTKSVLIEFFKLFLK